jgi:hypothetical protein
MLFLGLLGSCKSDSKSSQEEQSLDKSSNELTTLSGEFIYTDSVAVFKKNDGIYGVIINANAKNLIAEAKRINPDPFASFDVILEAEIQTNPEKDAWPQIIDIQNVIKIQASSSDDSLRLNK